MVLDRTTITSTNQPPVPTYIHSMYGILPTCCKYVYTHRMYSVVYFIPMHSRRWSRALQSPVSSPRRPSKRSLETPPPQRHPLLFETFSFSLPSRVYVLFTYRKVGVFGTQASRTQDAAAIMQAGDLEPWQKKRSLRRGVLYTWKEVRVGVVCVWGGGGERGGRHLQRSKGI